MVCENGRPLRLGKHPPPPWTTQTEQYRCLTPFVFSDNNDRLITESQDIATGDDSTTTYGYTGTQQTSKSVSVNSTLKTTQSFSYDLQGRMTMVRLETMNTAGTAIASVEETSFEYDTGGTRIASLHKIDSTNDGTFETIRRTEYLTDHANPTGYSQTIMETETDSSGNPIKRTVYTIGHDQISQTVYGPGTGGAAWDAGTTHYFGSDGHGSVRVLYDTLAAVVTSAANVLQVFHYDAYGNLLNLAATSALTSYLYSGEAFDTRIGQQYLRARWYDPSTGRLTSLDSYSGNNSDPQSLHKYLYAHGDPIQFTDPTGNLISAITSFVGNIFGRIQEFNNKNRVGLTAVTGILNTMTLVWAAYNVSKNPVPDGAVFNIGVGGEKSGFSGGVGITIYFARSGKVYVYFFGEGGLSPLSAAFPYWPATGTLDWIKKHVYLTGGIAFNAKDPSGISGPSAVATIPYILYKYASNLNPLSWVDGDGFIKHNFGGLNSVYQNLRRAMSPNFEFRPTGSVSVSNALTSDTTTLAFGVKGFSWSQGFSYTSRPILVGNLLDLYTVIKEHANKSLADLVLEYLE